MNDYEIGLLFLQTPELAINLFKQLGYKKNKIKRVIIKSTKKFLEENYKSDPFNKEINITTNNGKKCLSKNKCKTLLNSSFGTFESYQWKIDGDYTITSGTIKWTHHPQLYISDEMIEEIAEKLKSKGYV